jgi:hypothetical protein
MRITQKARNQKRRTYFDFDAMPSTERPEPAREMSRARSDVVIEEGFSIVDKHGSAIAMALRIRISLFGYCFI